MGYFIMNKYLGVKIVEARPKLGGIENRESGYEVVYIDGYTSWCPKEQFEAANRLINALPFGHAIEALKKGLKVARKGWNGKGMFLIHIDPYLNTQFHISEKEALVGTPIEYIAMKTADNKLVPWLASQTDMLATDWEIID